MQLQCNALISLSISLKLCIQAFFALGGASTEDPCDIDEEEGEDEEEEVEKEEEEEEEYAVVAGTALEADGVVSTEGEKVGT